VSAALALEGVPALEPERRVVISQPMLFPWVGLLEEIRLAHAYVHYDDVQMTSGGFINRVEVKTHQGVKWMTIPLAESRFGETIREARVSTRVPWRKRHLAMLAQDYARAPHVDEMLAMVRRVYAIDTDRLVDILVASMEELCRYFGLAAGIGAPRSSELGVPGKGTERVLAVVQKLGGSVYVTGHGARSYLDHEAFEASGVQVAYLDYQKTPYPQLHGAFTPYVSALDLVANLGKAGRFLISSGTVPWREFLAR
jgi:hypothetical protein